MVQSKVSKEDAVYHFAASGFAAIVNFPLWRASAIAQSGFQLEGSNVFSRYYRAVIRPPYRGVAATMLGMTWARAFIFFGSDVGKSFMKDKQMNAGAAQILPPLVTATLVQIINMPLVRATVTIQNPSSELNSVSEAVTHIYKTRGVAALWHGVSAGIMKTVPKYVTAVAVKDFMEDWLPHAVPGDKSSELMRSAVKSITAGVAGAALTNPLDVLRNEMFKTHLGLRPTFSKLLKEEGWAFAARGLMPNVTAVAIPIAVTIFTTDVLLSWKYNRRDTS